MLDRINSRGFSQFLLIIAALILLVLIYFGLNKFNNMNFFKYPPSPAPVALQTKTNSAKQDLYEQNKEKIKADLHLSEQQFQILKRYSGD